MVMVLAQAPENTLVGYVALSKKDFEAFVDGGELRPEIFSYPDVWSMYIPLDATEQSAIETALLQGTSRALEVADCDTTWHVLEVTFFDEAIAHMFQSHKLHWSTKNHRLELWAPIEAGWMSQKEKAQAGPRVEVKVVEVVLPRMDLDEWGDRVLSAQYSLQRYTWRAQCRQCRSSGRFLWMAGKRRDSKMYCAGCWHAHCGRADMVCGSLHELLAQRAAPPEEHDDDADAQSTGSSCDTESVDGSQWSVVSAAPAPTLAE